MTIRKATSKDSEFIAAYLWLAMDTIIYEFIGEMNPEKGKAFLRHFAEQEDNQYSYQNCWVVEDGTKVVAVANLYDGAKLQVLRQPILNYLNTQYSRTMLLEDETQAGEVYLDTFGVDPSQQGKGIGSKMLRFLIEEYVDKQGKTLGLLVDEDNPNAKKLYLKMGFKLVRTITFVGKTMEHLQIKGGMVLDN